MQTYTKQVLIEITDNFLSFKSETTYTDMKLNYYSCKGHFLRFHYRKMKEMNRKVPLKNCVIEYCTLRCLLLSRIFVLKPKQNIFLLNLMKILLMKFINFTDTNVNCGHFELDVFDLSHWAQLLYHIITSRVK